MKAIERTFISVAVLFCLVSCAHVGTTAQQDASRIIRVDEGIYRGPRPDDLSELRMLKVRTILNLEDNAEAVREEREATRQLGMTMINIPMSEIFRPSVSDLLDAVKILEEERTHPIYVHCLHGRDRTGFVIAAYRMIDQGWNEQKAYHEAVDNGHAKWFYDSVLGWEKSLRLIAGRKPDLQTGDPLPVRQ